MTYACDTCLDKGFVVDTICTCVKRYVGRDGSVRLHHLPTYSMICVGLVADRTPEQLEELADATMLGRLKRV